MPNIVLQPATVPVDAPFPPSSAQVMMNFVAAYLQVSGLESISGVVIGISTPAAADRDKAWVKLDPSSLRALGLFTFTGGEWTAIPIVVPSSDGGPPVSPKKGEIYFDSLGGLQIYNGTVWTSNLFPSGTTAARPTDVPVNYLYFDTDIARLLRHTSAGWTTLDGAVGDIKMVDAADLEDALGKNPGWSEFTSIAGKFPLGSSETYSPQTEGGAESIAWSAKGTSAHGGSRESPAIGAITFNGEEVASTAALNNTPSPLGGGSFKLLPPFKALIFLRKEF